VIEGTKVVVIDIYSSHSNQGYNHNKIKNTITLNILKMLEPCYLNILLVDIYQDGKNSDSKS
jgi:hypothetical protein